MKIKLTNVRLSFADLFEAKAFKPGDKPRYKATFLIPKSDPQIQTIEAAILEAVKTKFKVNDTDAKKIIAGIRGNSNKFCFQDGDTKTYDGYEGMMALGSSASGRPSTFGKKKNPITEADGILYSGCYVNASVELFGYDNSGKGVSCSLRGVQFADDGDAFAAGSPASEDEFEDLSEGADAGSESLA